MSGNSNWTLPWSQRCGFCTGKNATTLALAAHQKRGKPCYDLTSSNPSWAASLPSPSLATEKGLSSQLGTRYVPDPLGNPAARQLLSAHLGVPAHHLVLTAGTSDALRYILCALADPGDEVLIPSPGYPLLENLLQFEGIHAIRYPLRWDGKWYLPIGELKARCTHKTKAIITISPHNPTGHILSSNELDALLQLRFPLIIDEVFADYVFQHLTLAQSKPLHQGLVFSLGGMSKKAAWPAAKLSWIRVQGDMQLVTPAIERLGFISDHYLSLSNEETKAKAGLLRASQTKPRIQQRLEHNLSTLNTLLLPQRALELRVPAGGWFAPVRFPSTQSDENWCLRLLEDANTWLHPGYFYDFYEGCFLVCSLLCDEESFRKGWQAVVHCVEEILRSPV